MYRSKTDGNQRKIKGQSHVLLPMKSDCMNIMKKPQAQGDIYAFIRVLKEEAISELLASSS